jgi:hypothetical protein
VQASDDWNEVQQTFTVRALVGISRESCEVMLKTPAGSASYPSISETLSVTVIAKDANVDASLRNSENVIVMQARPDDWSSVAISWTVAAAAGTQKHEPDKFDVQLSTETAFDEAFLDKRVELPLGVFKTEITIPKDGLRTRATSLVSSQDFKSPLEIWQQVVYVRVRSVSATNTTSAWSGVSEQWTVAGKCGGRYLETEGTDMQKWECKACPPGANCDTDGVGLALHTLSPKRDFARVAWKYSGHKDQPFDRCPFKWSCNGNATRAAVPMSNNHTLRGARLLAPAAPASASAAESAILFDERQCFNNSAGVLCALCKPKYVRRGQMCELCVASGVAMKLACIALVVAIVVILVCVCRVRLRRLRRKYGPLWRDVVRIVTINITFMQINASLPSMFSNLGLPTIYLEFLSTFDFVNLDLMSFFSLPCLADSIDFRVSVVVAGMAPVIVVVCALLAYAHRRLGLKRAVSKVGHSEKLRLEAAEYLFDLLDVEGDQMIDVGEFQHLLSFLGVPAEQTKNKEYVRKAMSKMTGGGGAGNAGAGNAEEELSRQQFLHGITHGAVADMAGANNKWVMVAEKERVKTSYLSSVMLVFLLIHAPVSQRVFYYMSFRTVKGRSFLTKDYSIEFGAETWLSFLPVVVIITVVFTFGFPITIGFLLFKNRAHLQSAHMRRRLGFLYRPFVVGAEYWELHEVFRKMILTGVLIFVREDVRAAVAVLVCVLSVATLNFARPHHNHVVFWVAEMSFLLTCFKYLTAIFIATRASGALDAESDSSLASVLIGLDVAMLVGSVASSVAVLFVLRAKSSTLEAGGAGKAGKSGNGAVELGVVAGKRDGTVVVPRQAAGGGLGFRQRMGKQPSRFAGLGRKALVDKKAHDLEDNAEEAAKRMRKRLEVQHVKASARLQHRIERRKTVKVAGAIKSTSVPISTQPQLVVRGDAEGSIKQQDQKQEQASTPVKASRHSPPATASVASKGKVVPAPNP